MKKFKILLYFTAGMVFMPLFLIGTVIAGIGNGLVAAADAILAHTYPSDL
jgi:hypothetical protein